MPSELQLSPGTLNSTCYPASAQTLYNEMFEKGAALIGDAVGVVVSASAPNAEDRDKMWVKTSGGSPVNHFIYYNGAWVWPHPIAASSHERRLWVGDTASLVSYDGGSAGTVGDASGPIWEVDSEFAGRFPMGVGTIPNRTIFPQTIGVTGKIGHGEITQTGAQVGSHQHEIQLDLQNLDGGPEVALSNDFVTNEEQTLTQVNQLQADVEPMSILNPAYGVYFIKRTARIWLVGA